MEIHPDSLAVLQSSSTEGIAKSMHRVAAGLADQHWLPVSHRYRNKGQHRGSNRLQDDLSSGSLHSAELSEYVGISAPVHTMDGWSLLGRAVHCLLRGDYYNAVHLAYYSELRAALALLASQGIGVFNNPHCVIDSDSGCKLLKPVDENEERVGNHQWTWLVFKWWAQQPRATELLRKVIRPGGQPLGTWVDAMTRARFALEGIGAEWLKLWGIDISRYLADRDARNVASYWPNTINSWEARTILQDYQAVSDMWQPLEPTSESRFARLDKYLVRIVLSQGHFGATGKRTTSTAGRSELEGEVETLLRNMGMSESTRIEWTGFLTDAEVNDPPIVQTASGKSKVGTTSHVVEVMCRATMLLRLATGASAGLLSDAGIGRERLEFWIQAIGTGRGIWQPKAPPEDLVDLWADVEAALEQIEDSTKGTQPNAEEIWVRESRGMAILGECERVALWGLGL